MSRLIQQQLHGYRSGHQLLQSSLRLGRKDQDLIDQLSDIAGPLRPGEKFDAYICAYPLPSLQYYVLSRTEQDFDAPRAGCVKTKSLLVPQHYWENEAIPSLLTLLFERPKIDKPIPFPTDSQIEALAPVNSPLLAELIEALLLEKRRSIVVFDAPNPQVIALRLLTAFWPNMRRSFSLCTFALSPRTLSGKSFDLVFSPKSARSRFSNWDGRRIERTEKATRRRHRWTFQIEQRVFRSVNPHLLDPGNVKALITNDDEADEGILRVSLLWGELQEKAISSPTAVLGLIDIANSRNAIASTWEILEPAITNAVDNAAETKDTESAWNFLTMLMDKLASLSLTNIVSEALQSAGTKLARRDWRSAFNYLVGKACTENDYSREVVQAVANAIGASNPQQLTEALAGVSSERLIRIVLLNDRLLARTFTAADKSVDVVLVQKLNKGLQSLTPDERRTHRRRFLPHIRGDQDSTLLARLVVDAQTVELIEAIELVWGVNALRASRLGEVFCNAAVTNDSRIEVRAVFAHLSDDEQTNRCIERLLVADPSDMRWLLESAETAERRICLLNTFIEKSEQSDLEKAFNCPRIATKALKLLAGDLGRYASATARIVVLPTIAATDQITFGLKIFSRLRTTERDIVGQSIANRVLMDAGFQNGDQPKRVLDIVANDIDLSSVINTVLDAHHGGEQVSRTLVLFERLSSNVRTLLKARTDLIVELVVDRTVFDLTVDGAVALAKLIESADTLETEEFVQICSKIFPFAVAARHKPASPIIIATFPAVYDRLQNSGNHFGFMNFFMFADWDKSRIARKDLVRAFLSSEWPPVDLAVAAFHAGAIRRILKRLMKEPGGADYMDKIEIDVKYLKKGIRNPILKAIREVRNSDSFVLESET